MTQWFEGVDFAGKKNIATCYLKVANDILSPHFGDSPDSIERTGVDCPFGTSLGFSRLLQNQPPNYDSSDAFKTRHTERWLRAHLWDYQTSRWWQEEVAENPQCYVNKPGHVQSTIRLEIVPGFLDWFRQRVGNDQFADAIKQARRGENAYVEAHPRAFLYSAVERIWCSADQPPIGKDELRAVVRYKDAKRESRLQHRETVYKLLQQYGSAWLPREYTLADPPQGLLLTDHAFDAWLSAVTAFAHSSQLTIGWQDAGITEEEVDAEGHILVLEQTRAKGGAGTREQQEGASA